MEEIVSKELCTGCTACKNVCPAKAIEMSKSDDGFEYPKINQSKCINCGMCQKACPIINTKENKALNKTFVGFNKNEKVREVSSSGGIFSIIANYVLSNNGIVIGARFDEDNKLKHFAITNKKDLNKLRSSKYLQSELGSIFELVKENINNKKILFSGTPCHVAGLKAYLKQDYDNLICIDVICHGVPTPKLFDKYVKELENERNAKLLNYNFRDKSSGWEGYSNRATFDSGKNVITKASQNPYMKLFLSDIALRESCYHCNFKLGNKYSDITLGDFWGVKNCYPDMYNEKGVSCIILNTKKGENIFNEIKSEIDFKECTLENILKGNPSLKFSGKEPEKRKEFFYDLNKLTINKLEKKYIPRDSIIKRGLRKVKRIIKKIMGR